MSARAPRVVATQIPSKKDPATGIWQPTVNVTPATKFGELEVLLPAGMQFYAANEMMRIIKHRLNEIDFQPEDFFLPMGSPAVMAVAAAIAARRSNGVLNVLQWDNLMGDYTLYRLDNLV